MRRLSGAILATAALAVWHLPSSAAVPVVFPETKPASQCAAPAASLGGPSNEETRYIETALLPALTGSASQPATLAARMKARKVPGVSVAVFSGGKIVWARGWGVRDAGRCLPVTPQTVFQAASISKTLAALLAMREVERGALVLDADVNGSLRRWKLPRADAFAPGMVTLRQLLSHTGGTSVSGFPGYAPGRPKPSLVEMLDGSGAANNAPVRIEAPPGVKWGYSGGGYQILQTVLEDTTGRSFADLARRDLFDRVGMRRSSFAQPLVGPLLADSATGHAGGNPFLRQFHVYPELAAAGLWTTPSDLARLLIDIQAAAQGRRGRVVSTETAKAMLTPGLNDWGLGFALWDVRTARRFGHFGGNFGFLSQMWSFTDKGEGIVILTNGEGGIALAEEIVRAVANRRGWTAFSSRPLAAAMAADPMFLRGSMNDWSATSQLRRGSTGAYEVELTLKPGRYEFKIGAADWARLALGSENALELEPGIQNSPLSSAGGNIALRIATAGDYRFAVNAGNSGVATLAVTRIASR